MKEELIYCIKQFIAKQYGYENWEGQDFELDIEDWLKFHDLICYIRENF